VIFRDYATADPLLLVEIVIISAFFERHLSPLHCATSFSLHRFIAIRERIEPRLDSFWPVRHCLS
jgi:hypothetical protein